MPSAEASRRNLEKARAHWRAPRPWRSEEETRVVRCLAWQWFIGQEPRCSGRAIARKLGVSHTYIQKLSREFATNPTGMLETASRLVRIRGGIVVCVNGQLRKPEYREYTTFEQLAQAQRQSRKMSEQGLLRYTTYREAVARMVRGYSLPGR
jgi:hypothetical protein